MNCYQRKKKDFKALNKTKELARKINRYSSFEIKEFSLIYLFLHNLKNLKERINELIKISFHNSKIENLKKALIEIVNSRENFVDFNLIQKLEENGFLTILNEINNFSGVKGISENLKIEKFDFFLNDLKDEINNLEMQNKLNAAEESFSKNMSETQFNEFLSLKNQIIAAKKV